jgi:hypothetical protein
VTAGELRTAERALLAALHTYLQGRHRYASAQRRHTAKAVAAAEAAAASRAAGAAAAAAGRVAGAATGEWAESCRDCESAQQGVSEGEIPEGAWAEAAAGAEGRGGDDVAHAGEEGEISEGAAGEISEGAAGEISEGAAGEIPEGGAGAPDLVMPEGGEPGGRARGAETMPAGAAAGGLMIPAGDEGCRLPAGETDDSMIPAGRSEGWTIPAGEDAVRWLRAVARGVATAFGLVHARGRSLRAFSQLRSARRELASLRRHLETHLSMLGEMDAILEAEAYGRSRRGKAEDTLAFVFLGYAAQRVAISVFSLLRRTHGRAAAAGSISEPVLFRALGHAGAMSAASARAASLLVVGLLLVSSTRGFLRNVARLSARLDAAGKRGGIASGRGEMACAGAATAPADGSIPASAATVSRPASPRPAAPASTALPTFVDIIGCTTAHVMGFYFFSAVLLVRASLPLRYRGGIEAAVGRVEFSFYHHWFDAIFLFSAGVAAAVTALQATLASNRRRFRSESEIDVRDSTQRQRHVAIAARDRAERAQASAAASAAAAAAAAASALAFAPVRQPGCRNTARGHNTGARHSVGGGHNTAGEPMGVSSRPGTPANSGATGRASPMLGATDAPAASATGNDTLSHHPCLSLSEPAPTPPDPPLPSSGHPTIPTSISGSSIPGASRSISAGSIPSNSPTPGKGKSSPARGATTGTGAAPAAVPPCGTQLRHRVTTSRPATAASTGVVRPGALSAGRRLPTRGIWQDAVASSGEATPTKASRAAWAYPAKPSIAPALNPSCDLEPRHQAAIAATMASATAAAARGPRALYEFVTSLDEVMSRA